MQGISRCPDCSGGVASAADVQATLLVQLPVPTTRLEAKWERIPETSEYLEELRVLNMDRSEDRGWPPKDVLVPTPRMGCVGLDPDTGLLVLVGGGLSEHYNMQTGRRSGYGSGEGSDSIHASDLEEDGADGGEKTGATEYIPFSWQARLRALRCAAAASASSKRPKRTALARRRATCFRRDTCFRNPARNNLLVVPPDGPAFSLPLDGHDPLVTAVEVHALSSLQGYPFPSIGIVVALTTGSRRKFTGPLTLVACELSPVMAKCVSLTTAESDCQAFCLDRTGHIAISIEVRPNGHCIAFRSLRAPGASSGGESSHPIDACGRRATSIAWCRQAAAILLTFAGEHAIYVYQKVGAELGREIWQPMRMLGDASQRGCEDGPASKLRFWFPTADCRLVQGPYNSLMKDSCPLVPGPTGTVYIHSGGVLLRLADDLASASKITSMREELWLTDDDEGTPIFPTCQSVFGVCEGNVYRSLVRTDDSEQVLIRRLQISSELMQTRSCIRASAPRLWPNLTERREYVHPQDPGVAPTYYHEAQRDKWDGNTVWLADDWLWEDCPQSKPQDLRVSESGSWITFARWLRIWAQYGEHRDALRMAQEAFLERWKDCPQRARHPNHPHQLEKHSCHGICVVQGHCGMCGNSIFGFGCYECPDCSFLAHPHCILEEEGQFVELETKWRSLQSLLRASYFQACKPVLPWLK